MSHTVKYMQSADIAEGYATRDDWWPILESWMSECRDNPESMDRYYRLLTVYGRCLRPDESTPSPRYF